MLFQSHKPSSAGVLSAGDVARLTLDGIISGNPITKELCAPLRLPEAFRLRLERTWDTFRGPARNLMRFRAAEIELHQSRHGYVSIYVQYRDGAAFPGVELITACEDEDAEDEMEDVLEIETDQVTDEHTEKFWGEVWTPFIPVEQLRRETGPRPNDRCLCGSGRKHKRCCGRHA